MEPLLLLPALNVVQLHLVCIERMQAAEWLHGCTLVGGRYKGYVMGTRAAMFAAQAEWSGFTDEVVSWLVSGQRCMI
jgi:hypothetical protein